MKTLTETEVNAVGSYLCISPDKSPTESPGGIQLPDTSRNPKEGIVVSADPETGFEKHDYVLYLDRGYKYRGVELVHKDHVLAKLVETTL